MIVTPSKERRAKYKPYRVALSNRIKHQARIARRRFSGNRAFQASLYDGELASKQPQRRVVLYLAWGEITPAKKTALASLAASGLDVFVIVNRKSSADYKAYLAYARVVMDRPNWGYDFGGWKDGVQYFNLSEYDFLYFVNDSIIGPWAPVTQHLDAFEQSEAGVFGVTDSVKITHHIQSYFFGLSAEVYRSTPFQKFWHEIMFLNDRGYAIHKGEIEISLILQNYLWYIVAHYSELLDNDRNNANKVLSIVGNRKKYLWDVGGVTLYHREIIKKYNFPIIKTILILHNPNYLDDFNLLIEE